MSDTCDAWGGKPGESTGLICTEPRGHEGDHDGSGCGQWPNNLDRMTRVESTRAMAAYVGASEEQILEAEAAGREEARTGAVWKKLTGVDWRKKPMEALQFLCMEARADELSKMPEKLPSVRVVETS